MRAKSACTVCSGAVHDRVLSSVNLRWLCRSCRPTASVLELLEPLATLSLLVGLEVSKNGFILAIG